MAAATCPHCGREFARRGARTNHVRACAKRPGRETMRRWRHEERLTVAQMAERVGVARSTMTKWLKAEGLAPMGRRRRQLLDVRPEWAPFFGEGRSCSRCVMVVSCRQRQGLGLWVLCEAPEPTEVERVGVGVVVLWALRQAQGDFRRAQGAGQDTFPDGQYLVSG